MKERLNSTRTHAHKSWFKRLCSRVYNVLRKKAEPPAPQVQIPPDVKADILGQARLQQRSLGVRRRISFDKAIKLHQRQRRRLSVRGKFKPRSAHEKRLWKPQAKLEEEN